MCRQASQPQNVQIRNRRRLLLFLLSIFFINACARPAVTVEHPLPYSLGDRTLSTQVTHHKSPMRFVAPEGRYADWLRPRINNGLIDEGFILKKKSADLHLHIEVTKITTGGSNRQATCKLSVALYDEWPGDLAEEMKKREPQFPEPRLFFLVETTEKIKANGYPRAQLAEQAAEKALAALLEYIVDLR